MFTLRGTVLAALAACLTVPAYAAAAGEPECSDGSCSLRLTAQQVLSKAEELVHAKRFAEARPLIMALAMAPGYTMQSRYLTGYVAAQTGDLKGAAKVFRAILVDDPKQTQVRLDYSRVLLAMGQNAGADHQLRLAAEDDELPPEIARTIRTVRNIIRSKRAWTLNLDVGFAPDSNINNATAYETVNSYFGQLSLDKNARARSGTGVTGSVDAGLRLPIADDTLMLVDVNAVGTSYQRHAYDDVAAEVGIGPEFKLNEDTRFRIQGVAAQRDFGNRIATRQFGVKTGLELTLGNANRLGLQIDARRTQARFDRDYGGWQLGAYATYERVVAKSMIASASVFVRRDWLVADTYSSTEVGGIVGIGGELPKGFNFGISGGGSRAKYDAPMWIFSTEPRHDWRYNARVTIGNRGVRLLGFSPSFTYSYGRSASSIDYYSTQRSRFRFVAARYF